MSEGASKIHDVYFPMYENRDKFVILLTGGRGSGKSHSVSQFVERLTFEEGHKILFSRYTMVSASTSIIPEVVDKIERDGLQDYFNINKNVITNLATGSEIIFRGILASSGNQTAKLKSIQGLTTFVCDEAEEWVSERDFDTLALSIREKNVQNRVIIVMNPCSTSHFIYRKYIKDTHRIELYDGIPVQISTHPSVLHIHTTYQDNLQYLSEEFLNNVKRIKETDPLKYARTVIGQWNDQSEGVVFENVEVVDAIPAYAQRHALGLDFGYANDSTACVMGAIHRNDLYLDELFYGIGMSYGDIIEKLQPFRGYKVIADASDPRAIDEIYKRGKINIYPVRKGAGSIIAGIEKMREMNIKVTKRSLNLIRELNGYVWDTDKEGQYINLPVDANNDCIDASRYYVYGHLLGKISRRGSNNIEGVFQ